MNSVVVVGAINVDLVVSAARLPGPGETVAGGEFHQFGGGKGANAAVAAARQGAAVTLLGAVGDDDLGRWSLDQLGADSVDVSRVAVVDAATGVAVIVVDANGENQIAVGAGANEQVAPAAVAAAIGEADCVLISTEINDAAVAAAVTAATERGATCILNPAPVVAAAIAAVGQGAILTPNETELRQLVEALHLSDGDLDGRAVGLARRNHAPVVVTLGSSGVAIARPDADELVMIPAGQVKAVDTTGAGDTFNGAFAARLAAGDELEAAVRWAAAAASLSVTVAGARPGMPNAAAVAAALDER